MGDTDTEKGACEGAILALRRSKRASEKRSRAENNEVDARKVGKEGKFSNSISSAVVIKYGDSVFRGEVRGDYPTSGC